MRDTRSQQNNPHYYFQHDAFIYRTPRLTFRLTRKMPPAPSAATSSCTRRPALPVRRLPTRSAQRQRERASAWSRRLFAPLPPSVSPPARKIPPDLAAPDSRSAKRVVELVLKWQGSAVRATPLMQQAPHNSQAHLFFANCSQPHPLAKPICMRRHAVH